MKYAVSISDQGRFAPTQVGDFCFLPEHNLHVWKGTLATTMRELAEQVNAATASLLEFGSPFTTLRVVEVDVAAAVDENIPTPETTNAALLEANRELRETIARMSIRKPSLRLIEEAA